MCNLLIAKNKLYKDPFYRAVGQYFPLVKDNEINKNFIQYLDSLIGSQGNTRQEVINTLVDYFKDLNNDLLKLSPNIRELKVLTIDPLVECKRLLDNH